MACSIELADEIDIVRGDMLARPNNRPYVGRDIDAMVCWFSEDSTLTAHSRFALMAGTRSTRTEITGLAIVSTSTPCTGTRRRRRCASTRSHA